MMWVAAVLLMAGAAGAGIAAGVLVFRRVARRWAS